MIKDIQEGISCVSAGFSLARRPGLRPYMVVPLVANVILFSICGYLVVHYAYAWISTMTTSVHLWSWLSWAENFINDVLSVLKWFLFTAIILLALFLMSSTFTMIAHLLISPFIGILGEKAEKELHTPRFPQHSIAQIAWRTTKRELRKLIYWLVRALGLAVITLILYFIPLVNAATPVIWFLFGSWVLALQYIDVPADNNGRSFDDVLKLMRSHRAAVMGFGAVIMLVTSIPVVNLFVIPVAVCGGVVFWVRKFETLPAVQNDH